VIADRAARSREGRIVGQMIGNRNRSLGGVGAIVLCVLCIALPSLAADDDGPDLYVEYSGGLTITPNQRIIGNDFSGSNLSGRVESDAGFNVGLAFGKRFFEHFRADIQLTYRENEVSNLSLRRERDNASGHIGLLAIMANGYVDWDLGIGVIPYFGAGMGWGSVEIEAKNRAARQTQISGRDSVFAWSLMAGGSYPVNEVLDLSLGYRYIATTDPKINSSITDPQPTPPASKRSRRLEAEYDAHEVVVGLRFNF
jgi:OOP family OmpA-OmpF porin